MRITESQLNRIVKQVLKEEFDIHQEVNRDNDIKDPWTSSLHKEGYGLAICLITVPKDKTFIKILNEFYEGIKNQLDTQDIANIAGNLIYGATLKEINDSKYGMAYVCDSINGKNLYSEDIYKAFRETCPAANGVTGNARETFGYPTIQNGRLQRALENIFGSSDASAIMERIQNEYPDDYVNGIVDSWGKGLGSEDKYNNMDHSNYGDGPINSDYDFSRKLSDEEAEKLKQNIANRLGKRNKR